MDVYIKYNSEGEILSVSKVDVMAEGMEHPFVLLDETEAVLKAPNRKAFREATALEIHENYQVNMATGNLVKKR